MFQIRFNAVFHSSIVLSEDLLRTVDSDTSMTRLQCARRNGYITIVRLCLDHASPLVVGSDQCFNPLSLAYEEKHIQISQLILTKFCTDEILTPLSVYMINLKRFLDLVCERDDSSMVVSLLQNSSLTAQNTLFSMHIF